MPTLTRIQQVFRNPVVAVGVATWLFTFTYVPTSCVCQAEEYDSIKIQGLVKSDGGSPLANVKVIVNNTEGASSAPDNNRVANTDDQGHYEITLRIGKGETLIVREVFADLQDYVRGSKALQLELRDGQVGTVDFSLAKGVRLAGKLQLPLLRHELNLPPELIRRVLVISNPEYDKLLTLNARCQTVRADGAFDVTVPEGVYTLSVIDYRGTPKWEGVQAPRSDVTLELPPFEWNEENLGAVFDELWSTMDAGYSYFILKPDVDWQALKTIHRPKIIMTKTPQELAAALRDMLAAFNDMHVFIETPDGYLPTREGGYDYNGNQQVTRSALTDIVPCGKFALVGKTKADGFGYFLMLNQSSANPASVQKAVQAIRELKDTPGFIVDLRKANGGSEPLALEIARQFCTRPTVYAKSKYRAGAQHDRFGRVFERRLPDVNDAYTKPVLCLIGPGAVSSGEGFVQMMKCLPQVTTVGMPTRGASGNPAPFDLSNSGVAVYFSRWVDMLPDESTFEGVGISPDVRVDLPAAEYEEADPTLEKGLEVLRKKIKAATP